MGWLHDVNGQLCPINSKSKCLLNPLNPNRVFGGKQAGGQSSYQPNTESATVVAAKTPPPAFVPV
jgi:hypothetical protein